MTSTELAYIAGIFDGEGYIGFHKKRNSHSSWITVRIKMSDRNTIEYLQKTSKVGGISIYIPNIPNRKVLYIWQIFSNQALVVLNDIYPYLITKKQKVDEIIELDRQHKALNLRKRRFQTNL